MHMCQKWSWRTIHLIRKRNYPIDLLDNQVCLVEENKNHPHVLVWSIQRGGKRIKFRGATVKQNGWWVGNILVIPLWLKRYEDMIGRNKWASVTTGPIQNDTTVGNKSRRATVGRCWECPLGQVSPWFCPDRLWQSTSHKHISTAILTTAIHREFLTAAQTAIPNERCCSQPHFLPFKRPLAQHCHHFTSH